MKESARYVKIVEWSEEDQCFVGSCPGLFYGGCHGNDEKEVFAEVCGAEQRKEPEKAPRRAPGRGVEWPGPDFHGR